jgi:hypothetical protein
LNKAQRRPSSTLYSRHKYLIVKEFTRFPGRQFQTATFCVLTNLQCCRRISTFRKKFKARSLKTCFFEGVKKRKIIWLFSEVYICSQHKETFNRTLLNTQISPNESYSHVTYIGPTYRVIKKSLCT